MQQTSRDLPTTPKDSGKPSQAYSNARQWDGTNSATNAQSVPALALVLASLGTRRWPAYLRLGCCGSGQYCLKNSSRSDCTVWSNGQHSTSVQAQQAGPAAPIITTQKQKQLPWARLGANRLQLSIWRGWHLQEKVEGGHHARFLHAVGYNLADGLQRAGDVRG